MGIAVMIIGGIGVLGLSFLRDWLFLTGVSHRDDRGRDYIRFNEKGEII